MDNTVESRTIFDWRLCVLFGHGASTCYSFSCLLHLYLSLCVLFWHEASPCHCCISCICICICVWGCACSLDTEQAHAIVVVRSSTSPHLPLVVTCCSQSSRCLRRRYEQDRIHYWWLVLGHITNKGYFQPFWFQQNWVWNRLCCCPICHHMIYSKFRYSSTILACFIGTMLEF